MMSGVDKLINLYREAYWKTLADMHDARTELIPVFDARGELVHFRRVWRHEESRCKIGS